jgi:hypothetical protein
MSKILQAGETGFGILIEHDSGYISSEINKDILNENFELKPNEPVLVNCILQKWGVKNKNGRIYPKDVLIPQVQLYQELVNTNSAVSECFSPDTKILTKDGWKLIKNISNDEEILTLNRITQKTEYQKITKKINDDYIGLLYHIKSLNIDIKVTPNHRFIIEDSKNELIEVTADELFSSTENNIFWNGKYKLLKRFNYEYDSTLNFCFDECNIKSEDFYSFMGIYLAEGCVITDRYLIQITQKKESVIRKIEELLNNTKLNYIKHTRKNSTVDFHIKNRELFIYLSKLGKSYQKYIPTELKDNSPQLLKILFDWYMLGDGRNVRTRNKKTKEFTGKYKQSVFTVSKKLIYDLQEILLKSGGSGNITIDTKRKDRKIIDKLLVDGDIINKERIIKRINSSALFSLNVSKTNNIYLDKRTIKINKINYSGKIVCVKVPNETIFIMRNGKALWTLNSDHPDSSIISLQNISHMITKMWWGKGEQENVLYGQLKIIVSPGYIRYGVVSVIGDKIVLYLQNKIKLGISSRGVGTLKEVNGENLVQADFELIGFDLVATPSTPGAFLFPAHKGDLSFGENYINKNGILLKEEEGKLITALNKFLL